ncbi:proline-rich protein 11-like isoform X2 [Mizuhopecten yessoensis]|nr:proline-rich protein 11-like isoform X2 [Mizuhopecten yessoensis]
MTEAKSDYRLESFDEYDEPCQMTKAYCGQLSLDQYEEQAANTTEQAVLDLLSYLDKNPQKIQSILTKRKKEELENCGMFSFLKMKWMCLINGDKNGGVAIPEEECQAKLEGLKLEMTKVLDYSLKSRGRRCSSRLAAKRQKMSTSINKENIRTPVAENHIPPPPPPPPPVISVATPGGRDLVKRGTPLKDLNFTMDTPKSLMKVKRKHERTGSDFSVSSMTTIGSFSSLQQELLSSNPLRRLRTTNRSRSPGGTPSRNPRFSIENPANLSTSEPLYRAFVNSMQHKFRNVRSPSPAGRHSNFSSPGDALSPGGFTP